MYAKYLFMYLFYIFAFTDRDCLKCQIVLSKTCIFSPSTTTTRTLTAVQLQCLTDTTRWRQNSDFGPNCPISAVQVGATWQNDQYKTKRIISFQHLLSHYRTTKTKRRFSSGPRNTGVQDVSELGYCQMRKLKFVLCALSVK